MKMKTWQRELLDVPERLSLRGASQPVTRPAILHFAVAPATRRPIPAIRFVVLVTGRLAKVPAQARVVDNRLVITHAQVPASPLAAAQVVPIGAPRVPSADTAPLTGLVGMIELCMFNTPHRSALTLVKMAITSWQI